MRERLIANCGQRFSTSVLWRFFDRHKMTFKKKTAHAEEQQRSDVLKRRRDWFDGQLDRDPSRLVFVDETGTSAKWRERVEPHGTPGRGTSSRRLEPRRDICRPTAPTSTQSKKPSPI